MESITKNKQSDHTLRAMIRRAYGDAELPDRDGPVAEEITTGYFNAVYRVRLRSRKCVVLKVAPSPSTEVMRYEENAMRTELAAIDLVRSNTSVPVPVVDYADFSHDLCDSSYFFMRAAKGQGLEHIKQDLDRSSALSYDKQLGEYNKQLNAIVGPGFGSLEHHPSNRWSDAYSQMWHGVLLDGQRHNVDLGVSYDELATVTLKHEYLLDEVEVPRFVQWDLWDGNCIVQDGQVELLIDFERCFFGDPLMEFGFASMDRLVFGDKKGFLEGYGSQPTTYKERKRRLLYDLHLFSIQAIEGSFRQYADTTAYQWARTQVVETFRTLSAYQ